MMNTATSTTNEMKAAAIARALDELLQQALRRGFYGTVRLEATVQDGTIQHVRRVFEQLEK